MNSRYYDPETGRFINADDVSTLDITKIAINGLNLYAYCLNNPVNEVDESGMFLWWLLLAVIIGAIVGGAVNGVKAYNEGARGWDIVGSVLGGAVMGGAMGGLLAFGGGIGVGVIGGFTFGSGLLLSAGVGIVAGWSSYSIESLLRSDKNWNLLDFGKAGFTGLLKGLSTFTIGFFGGRNLGAYDKLILNPLLKNAETLDFKITYSIAKILMGRTAFLSPLAEFLLKTTILGGLASGVRHIIDKIFGT